MHLQNKQTYIKQKAHKIATKQIKIHHKHFESVFLAVCLLQEQRQENKHTIHTSALPKGLWPVLTLARFYLVASTFLEKILNFPNLVGHCVKGEIILLCY